MKHNPAIAPSAARTGEAGQDLKAARRRTRVMLIDDSVVVRSILHRLIYAHPQFDIVASVAGAPAALALLETQEVDVIILDIEMPCGNGLDAMPDLLARSDARILVLSSLAEPGGEAAVRALSIGACDTLAKPGRSSFGGQFASILMDKLTALGQPVSRQSGSAEPPVIRSHMPDTSRLACLAIGSSTGGIPAITEFLTALDPNIPVPILLTQHLPAAFLPFLVRQFNAQNNRKVKLAQQGMPVEANTVYVAPGTGHMQIVGQGSAKKFAIAPDQAGRYVPAVDPMLASVAEHYGASAAAVILSGMGRDGLLGAEKIAAKGGRVYVQDPATSVVWGMPGVVARAGMASAILPPAQIAAHIAASYRQPPATANAPVIEHANG